MNSRLEHRFEFPLTNGLHARPASHLQAIAAPFASEITLLNERSGLKGNAKSVLALLTTNVRKGDVCRLEIEGRDAEAAFSAIEAFLQGDFLRCDESPPEVTAPDSPLPLPRSLNSLQPLDLRSGTCHCAGVGAGRIHFIVTGGRPAALDTERPGDLATERARLRSAITAVLSDLDSALSDCHAPLEQGVLQAHRAILLDPAFADQIDALLVAGAHSAGQAVAATADSFIQALRSAESHYLRERAIDIDDICGRLLHALYGAGEARQVCALRGPTVCVASMLTPGQFLALDRSHLKALVLGEAGATSHTVLLARTFGIPTIGGLGEQLRTLPQDAEAIVDSRLGLLFLRPSEALRRHYERELHFLSLAARKLEVFQSNSARTSDGTVIEVGANIGSQEEAALAFASGADGIGLFRTEMLFASRSTAPDEDEQACIYGEVLRLAAGKPVIIRLLDIGGDKPLPYLPLPHENNPFLGRRGVRLYPHFEDLILTQLRALLRAAVQGPLHILVPMISRVEELQAVRALLEKARTQLAEKGLVPSHEVKLGAMLEVPAVAFAMPELCKASDFFSLGTNDLTQYFFAVDRDNPGVLPLYTSSHPAFLKLLRQLIQEARAHGRWIGLCGGLAEDPRLQPLLLGLGLDEISVPIPRITTSKARIAGLAAAECRSLVDTLLNLSTQSELDTALDTALAAPVVQQLLTPELVILDSDAATKAEALREGVHTLARAGRTTQPDLVEEQLWKREDTYSTGFGGGFAIPHCQSPHLSANSLVILRSSRDIEWNSLDGAPVRNIVLLAIRADQRDKEHLRLLAKLSRLLMREEFQAHITGATDPAGLVTQILAAL